MLILSRRAGESIVIGNEVVVTVLDVRGDQIRIGVQAPREVQVHREEVHQQVKRENAQAASGSAKARTLIARMPQNARRPDGGGLGQRRDDDQPGREGDERG